MLAWAMFGEQWQLNHKVNFDPVNKVISTPSDLPLLDIEADVYSAWIQWKSLYNNNVYPDVLTVIPPYYFLLNDWQFQVDRKVTDVTGYLNPGQMIAAIKGSSGLAAWNRAPVNVQNSNLNKTSIPIF